MIEHLNQKKSMAAWAKEYNMHPATLGQRLKNKWPMEKALSFPVDSRKGVNAVEEWQDKDEIGFIRKLGISNKPEGVESIDRARLLRLYIMSLHNRDLGDSFDKNRILNAAIRTLKKAAEEEA